MSILEIIILGIVQGIAEFLPISSSAHLIIFRNVFGIGAGMPQDMELAFDIALHFGTLLSIIVFFLEDFLKVVGDGLTKGTKTKEGRLFWNLIIATIPAAIFGILFEDIIEDFVRDKYILIAIALAFMGIIIYICDMKGKQKKDVYKVDKKDSLKIGLAQVFALIPGFSRSGTTISAARLLGVKREDAAKFSFFMSVPVVAGAVVLKLIHEETWTIIMANATTFIIGILISYIIGLLVIKFLLKYLDNHNFKIFMIYRVVIAIIVIIFVLVK